MNSKKSKNKKRTKGAKTAENTKICEPSEVSGETDTVETSEQLVIETNLESSSNCNVVEDKTNVNNLLLVSEERIPTPTKPKRKKKKKHSDKNTSQDDITDQNNNSGEKEKVNPSIKYDISIDQTINQNKQTSNEDVLSEGIEKNDTKSSEAIMSQISKSKKKQKKTKHRLDSEISENADVISCTLAFDKLTQSDVTQGNSDIPDKVISVDENTTKDNKISKKHIENEVSSLDTPKRKKKGKRGTPASEITKDLNIKNTEITLLTVEPIQREEIIILDQLSDDKAEQTLESLKPKAKIAKPVNKNRKDKNKTTIENIKISQELVDQQHVGDMEVDLESDKNILQIETNSNPNDIKELKEEVLDISTVDKQEFKNIEVLNVEIEDSLSSSIDFVDVLPPKKKKRAKKGKSQASENMIFPETMTTLIVDQSNVGQPSNKSQGISDEIEDSNITPDLIQYPLSSSQQQLDRNNNMVIHEISSQGDVSNLDIQISSTPLVQGSGETPDVSRKANPMEVQVTEMNTEQFPSQETQLNKSSSDRDFEQGMKDLKLSIEKSFAELSSMDRDIEMQYQKLEDASNKNDFSASSFPSEIQFDEVCSTATKNDEKRQNIPETCTTLPSCPMRKDKGKGKSKKKATKTEQSSASAAPQTQSASETSQTPPQTDNKDKTDSTTANSKQKSDTKSKTASLAFEAYYKPIEKFEDALTSSTEDINKTFEMIACEAGEEEIMKQKTFCKPEIAITESEGDNDKAKNAKQHPVSQPKNFIGQPNIPVTSNKTDFKKEKHKPPSTIAATVKIKDSIKIDTRKECKSNNRKMSIEKPAESFTYKTNGRSEFVYKYSFRKVFLSNVCHVCRKELSLRVPCKFCSLVFYCSQKHKDEDWSLHQPLCFAVSTITHLKEQKFLYEGSKNITGHEYRMLRMQAIISCEKVLKRKLVPWEQEMLLYPRICAEVVCREWRQSRLTDCQRCGQIAYCADQPDHFPASHKRWCNSYSLYQKLINHQQTKGRLEPKLPSKVMNAPYQMPDKINGVLASLYEEKLALTQIASEPLTTAYAYQVYTKNSLNKEFGKGTIFTIHTIGADLQHEVESPNRWETFFLHLSPNIQDLRVVLINQNLNPSKLPLDLLNKVKLCNTCTLKNRHLLFQLEDSVSYTHLCFQSWNR
ncbi:unnamed protein product [Leptidea sinapis]|uniref:MYND-type domain-containing protein n=1 Tax=Leptidea sinapis TaxID=189913 RepID=A0A5E4Q6K2_9NEOP|nr:unnamed protein product [Leptidea sinapis]